jgi:L-iditol 2-dehydrogenase
MSFEHAALAEPLSSVLAAHHKAQTNISHTVVVLGGGPIGCLHIAVAHARGAKVILSEPSAERREMAAPFQPDAVIDPFKEDVIVRVRELTGGLGADIVVCANPIAATQTQAIEMVRKGGRVVLFGGLPKANKMVSFDSNRIHYDEIEVVGAFSYHPIFHEQALDVLQRGLIDGNIVITHIFSLDEVDQAFQASANGQALKAIVKP